MNAAERGAALRAQRVNIVFGARFAEGAPDRTDAAAAAPLRDGDARAPQRLLPPHLRFKWWLALGDDRAPAVTRRERRRGQTHASLDA